MKFFRLIVLLVGALVSLASAAPLPAQGKSDPLPAPHFPDTLHAVVWRNWFLVSPERLAELLETTPENVTQLATSMGLPADVEVPPEMLKRGYITLLRRNWHLLPTEQLIELLQISEEEYLHRLREDDFLDVKLGRQPNCPKVVYTPPTPEAKAHAQQIKTLVQKHFGDRLHQPDEPRFHFVEELETWDGPPPTGARPSREDPPRFVYSYVAMFGDPLSDPSLDPFPDGLLARLQDRGVNGVWLHVVLRHLAPPSETFPEFGQGSQMRLANLKKLAERAERFGIQIYLYMNEPRGMPEDFFVGREHLRGVPDRPSVPQYYALCTSQAEVRKWISDSLAHVFQQVPGLGGVFTISASENLTNCSSKFQQHLCPHCRDRSDTDILVEVNSAIAEGVHRSAPEAKVIVWDWGWARHGDASETIAQLPDDVWLMSVSEWDKQVTHEDVTVKVGEYSISAVGPGPRAQRHWQVAKQNGLKTAAKVQFNITWELAAVPYVPVLDLVAQHNANLAQAGLDGQMLSWSLGGYPSPNLELARLFAQQPPPTVDEALDQLALKLFGPEAAPKARAAWTKFSQAFQEYPYSGAAMYTGPQHQGPSNLLYAEPTGYPPGMVCFPYDALPSWSAAYGPELYTRQFEKLTATWQEAVTLLQQAQKLAGPKHQAEADDMASVAEAALHHFASVANQANYIHHRNLLAQAEDPAQRQAHQQAMAAALNREIEAATALYDVAAADSRIGYEASNHYFYVPHDLVEKVLNCEQLLEGLVE